MRVIRRSAELAFVLAFAAADAGARIDFPSVADRTVGIRAGADGFGPEAPWSVETGDVELFGIAGLRVAGVRARGRMGAVPAGVSLARPIVERAEGVMPLDEMTRRNLELTESLRGGAGQGTAGTLIDVLDRTATPMGARLLRQWILAPLANKPAIDER